MILNSIEDLKAHLGRAISSATKIGFIEPYIQLAQDDFIRPAIGDELLEELEQQHHNPEPGSLTPANAKLLKLLQRPLAFYAYVKYLPYALGTDGDFGLQETATDKQQPVRIGVLDKRQRESADNAANSLENALRFLYINKSAYPTWLNSPAYLETHRLFVYGAQILTDYIPQAAGSYRLFLSLKAYLSQAEKEAILPLLGNTQFDALKAFSRGESTTDADQKLLDSVRNASAKVAYANALYHLNVVQMASGGLRILSEFDGIYNQKAVDSKVLLQAQKMANAESEASLTTLKKLLFDYADDYPLYKNSDRYKPTAPSSLPDNSKYNGVFRMR